MKKKKTQGGFSRAFSNRHYSVLMKEGMGVVCQMLKAKGNT